MIFVRTYLWTEPEFRWCNFASAQSLIDISSLVSFQLAVLRDVRYNDNLNYDVIIQVQSPFADIYSRRRTLAAPFNK